MYNPLHHKYRPQTFAELVGQEAITTTLTNAILTQKIAPAYLFTGPRGTGKTSSARIFAKSLNCIANEKPTSNPCGRCEVCRKIADGAALDIIEIDAASNTGVDNIREIIERAQFAPVRCRYKVYIIDEVHMLSVAAFNALLKTLEEPPGRVVFVLATTDPQRVLSTIISRCQRFDFRRIPLEAMVNHLQNIAVKESINISPEAITIVGQISNGGLRDAESLLDQLSLLVGEITVEKVWDLVGAVPERDLFNLLQAINSDQPEVIIQQCRNLLDRGREPLVVLQNLAGFYLNLLIAKTSPHSSEMVAVTAPTWQALCTEAQNWDTQIILQGQQHLKNSEVQIKNTTQPRLWLEVTLLGLLPSAIAIERGHNQQQITSRQSSIPQSTTNNHSATNQQKSRTHQNVINKQTSTPQTTSNQQSITSHPVSNNQTTPITKTETSKKTFISQAINSQAYSTAQTTTNKPASSYGKDNSSQSQINDPGELQKIWHKIIGYLLPATQSLLREHCQLIILTSSSAIISAKNQTLLDITKGRKKNIEKAFQQVFNQEITVTMQIGNHISPQKAQNLASASFKTKVKTPEKIPEKFQNTPNSTHNTTSINEEAEKVSTQSTTSLRSSNSTIVKEETRIKENIPNSDIKDTTSTVIKEEVLVSGDMSSSDSISFPKVNLDINQEEISHAAKSLADTFSGEIIEISNEVISDKEEVIKQLSNNDLEDEYADF